MKKIFRNAALLLLLPCFLNSIPAQVFQNGNFASPGGNFGLLGDGTPGLVLPAGSTFVTGWVTTDNITGYNGPNRYNEAPGSSDGRSFELGAGGLNGGIQQTFATLPNSTYRVSFYMTSYWLANTPPELTASAAGQSAHFSAGPASFDRFNCVWELKQFDFISDGSGLTTLKFQNIINNSPGFGGAAEIDNVQVTLVPEPATASLLGLLGGIVLFQSKRARR